MQASFVEKLAARPFPICVQLNVEDATLLPRRNREYREPTTADVSILAYEIASRTYDKCAAFLFSDCDVMSLEQIRIMVQQMPLHVPCWRSIRGLKDAAEFPLTIWDSGRAVLRHLIPTDAVVIASSFGVDEHWTRPRGRIDRGLLYLCRDNRHGDERVQTQRIPQKPGRHGGKSALRLFEQVAKQVNRKHRLLGNGGLVAAPNDAAEVAAIRKQAPDLPLFVWTSTAALEETLECGKDAQGGNIFPILDINHLLRNGGRLFSRTDAPDFIAYVEHEVTLWVDICRRVLHLGPASCAWWPQIPILERQDITEPVLVC